MAHEDETSMNGIDFNVYNENLADIIYEGKIQKTIEFYKSLGDDRVMVMNMALPLLESKEYDEAEDKYIFLNKKFHLTAEIFTNEMYRCNLGFLAEIFKK